MIEWWGCSDVVYTPALTAAVVAHIYGLVVQRQPKEAASDAAAVCGRVVVHGAVCGCGVWWRGVLRGVWCVVCGVWCVQVASTAGHEVCVSIPIYSLQE